MRAEITIDHDQGDLLSEIVAVLGPHEPETLTSSNFARKSPSSGGMLQYAVRTPNGCVLAWATPQRLVVYVEPSGGRLRRAAHEVWDIVHRSGSSLHPRLEALVLLDEDANDEIANADVGLRANVRRREIVFTLLTGAATLVWLVVALAAFDATGDLVLGAIPSLLAALLATVVVIKDTRNRRLVWG